MNELTLSKALIEDIRFRQRGNTVDLTFARTYGTSIMEEGFIKNGPPDYNKIDWFVKPEKNGTDYITNDLQNFDINSCLYSSYYSTILGDSSYMLVNKYITYFGFESKASCWVPS
jgi:hypothetical protein